MSHLFMTASFVLLRESFVERQLTRSKWFSKNRALIIYTYISMTHYKLFSVILLICNVSISFTNCQLSYHIQLSNHHYIMSHNLV
jgi:hypothetical protein